MGARSYGAFVSVSALAAIVAAFSVWGADQLLIRTVANDQKAFPRAFGEALIYFLVTAPVFTVAAAIGFRFLIDAEISWTTIALVAVTEIIFARANYFAVNCFQAFERGRDMAMLGILLYAARVIAARDMERDHDRSLAALLGLVLHDLELLRRRGQLDRWS